MERNENGLRVRGGQSSPERDYACPGTGELWQGDSTVRDGCSDNSSCALGCSDKQLAMVYAPNQCWRMIFSPEDAMRHGTMFRELYKPLEGYEHE